VVGRVLTAPRDEALRTVDALATACAAHDGPGAPEAGWAARLAVAYPGDPGVVVALLLNLVTLAPGEALFLRAGVLHAYLGGAAVEVMANSDNVVRGGLTPKHVDVATLLAVLDPAPVTPDVQRPSGAVHRYRCPVPEFGLVRYELGAGDSQRCTVDGPELILVADGSATAVADRRRPLTLRAGEAAFVPAADDAYSLAGPGTVFRATIGAA
jgi:mannose-6-phosphate isomerase